MAAAAAVLSAVAMTIVGTTVTAVRYVGGDVGSLAVQSGCHAYCWVVVYWFMYVR